MDTINYVFGTNLELLSDEKVFSRKWEKAKKEVMREMEPSFTSGTVDEWEELDHFYDKLVSRVGMS